MPPCPPHQVRAFHRFYDNWPPKLLIADEVGLGKTGRAKRSLVLAPASVCYQWQIDRVAREFQPELADLLRPEVRNYYREVYRRTVIAVGRTRHPLPAPP